MRLSPSLIWLDAQACIAPAAGHIARHPLEGRWQGAWVRDGVRLEVALDFTRDRQGFTGTFSPQGLNAIRLPLGHVTYTAPRLYFELVGEFTTVLFDGILEGDAVTGMFVDGENRGPCVLTRGQAEAVRNLQGAVCFEADAEACAPQDREVRQPEFLLKAGS